MLKRKALNQDGFTLIELIVVVAILGILAAVLTPRVLDAVDDARNSAAESASKQIQLAMERYLVDNNHYPAEDDVDTPTELATVLTRYANLDAASLVDTAADDFLYVGYTNVDGTGDATNAGTTNKSYALKVKFKESSFVYVISPNNLDKDGSLTDDDTP